MAVAEPRSAIKNQEKLVSGRTKINWDGSCDTVVRLRELFGRLLRSPNSRQITCSKSVAIRCGKVRSRQHCKFGLARDVGNIDVPISIPGLRIIGGPNELRPGKIKARVIAAGTTALCQIFSSGTPGTIIEIGSEPIARNRRVPHLRIRNGAIQWTGEEALGLPGRTGHGAIGQLQN